MNQDRNQYNEDERIYATFLDSAGSAITGSTSVLLTIRRDSDGYIYDFGAESFKASGWTTSSQPMTELDSTSNPGTYYYDFDASAQGSFSAQYNYLMRADCSAAENTPAEGYLKLGGWIDGVGHGGGFTKIQGSGITQEMVDEIAKRVWKFVLEGGDTAEDVLLRKSEFDATKDYVLCEDKEMKEMMEMMELMHGEHSEKLDSMLKSLKPIDYSAVFNKVLDKIEKVTLFFKEAKNDIIEDRKSTNSEIDNEIQGIKTITKMLSDDILCSIEARKELEQSQDEKTGKILDKLEEQSIENVKNIKKILLKMTELKFDSDNSNVEDFVYIQEQLNLILDALEV